MKDRKVNRGAVVLACLCALLGLFVAKCMHMPDPAAIGGVVDKIDQAVACQEVAQDCYDASQDAGVQQDPLEALKVAKRCADRWRANQCTELLRALAEKAESL